MTQLVALCQINRKPQSGPLTQMSGYDPDGNPIVRAVIDVIAPGEMFDEPDAAEARWFIAQDAAREPTAAEVETYERLQSR